MTALTGTARSPAGTEARRRRYPPIADHGLIGDLQTAALVTTDGTVDWFCCPRFDSPSVFASLLDHDRGGYFQIAPDGAGYVTRQLYLPESAVLITRFMSEDGVGELVDFMPVHEPETPTRHHRLVRDVRVVRGTMRLVLECAPRFDYGRAQHDLELRDGGAVFRSPDLTLTLHSTTPVQRSGGDVRAEFLLSEGQVGGVILESECEGPPRTVSPDEVLDLFDQTVAHWRAWLLRSTYRGRWREIVARSAMSLRLMTYAPTGAPVAAPTAGLPEELGGSRNWDYRFTWVRDASFSIYTLLALGYQEEARHFGLWVRDRVQEEVGHAY